MAFFCQINITEPRNFGFCLNRRAEKGRRKQLLGNNVVILKFLQSLPKFFTPLTCHYADLLNCVGRLCILALKIPTLLKLGRESGHGQKKPMLTVGQKREMNSLLC